MENHPIPQDVTGFQFKLIGNMTVKQFAYVATGAILAVIVFYSQLHVFVKLPLLAFFLTLGFSLAFVPFEGRPMDLMFMYYFKALIVPNQYIYHKQGKKYVMPQARVFAPAATTGSQTHTQKPIELKEQQLQSYLTSLHAAMPTQTQPPAQIVHTPQPQVVAVPLPVAAPQPQIAHVPHPQFISITEDLRPAPKVYTQKPPVPPSQPEPEAEPEKKEKDLSIKSAELQQELAEAKLAEAKQQTVETAKAAHANTLALEKQLQEIAEQKAQLEQQLLQLKKQMDVQAKPLQTSIAQVPTPAGAPHPQQNNLLTKSSAMRTPDSPNLITGIVKDPRGNVLPNILIEILDKDNNPVRAFKTNSVGQFASATILPNGQYLLTFEDPKGQNNFGNVTLIAKGEILQPLEVISHDAREALRKELFS